MNAISSVYFVVLARGFLKNQPPIVSVLLRNYLTLRSRSERVRNAVGTRSERVPEETWKLVPNFGKKKRVLAKPDTD
jgi:hypothetical protein